VTKLWEKAKDVEEKIWWNTFKIFTFISIYLFVKANNFIAFLRRYSCETGDTLLSYAYFAQKLSTKVCQYPCYYSIVFPRVYLSFILLIGNFLLCFLASLFSRFPRLSSIILELVEPIVPVNCFRGRYCEVRSMAVLYVGYWSWRRSDTPAVGRPITYQLALPCGMFPFTMEKTLSRGLWVFTKEESPNFGDLILGVWDILVVNFRFQV